MVVARNRLQLAEDLMMDRREFLKNATYAAGSLPRRAEGSTGPASAGTAATSPPDLRRVFVLSINPG